MLLWGSKRELLSSRHRLALCSVAEKKCETCSREMAPGTRNSQFTSIKRVSHFRQREKRREKERYRQKRKKMISREIWLCDSIYMKFFHFSEFRLSFLSPWLGSKRKNAVLMHCSAFFSEPFHFPRYQKRIQTDPIWPLCWAVQGDTKPVSWRVRMWQDKSRITCFPTPCRPKRI